MRHLQNSKLGFKKRIKLFIKNNAFRFAHRIAIMQLKKIVKNSSIQPKIIKKGRKERQKENCV